MAMERNTVTRSELLDRWRSIEEEDDTDVIDQPLERGRLLQLKEQWFSDAFDFLISLPADNHVWCGNWNLMGPMLEPFYNYFRNKPDDPKSPLKMLYSRFANEMRQCTHCICKYHQAQETYNSDYEPSSITVLLDALRTLDEERVSNLLAEINSRLARREYDARCEAEVVCVMFEVLMFPYLLDDQSLAANFETFIEAIDDYHELTLTGNQQYPGVYALLFLKSRRARSIGLRLAGVMGKLRLVDLAPLQPLLKKCINFLENDITPLVAELRPRVQLDRITVWLGIKALLGFLEPPAFEEGILERYPVFLSIVLNHISDDSVEFSHAVNCLRLLFEMLGCKLWLRSTLSPNVMRNTLIGQCFHTRNEKIHKEIFELLQPFLQSLEALQDGEHGKQRRHFLYFLLHQVTLSSNFSVLMRKKACQIALLIVHRGYKMTPPSPPYECAHMWAPSLVSSLKDSSLHTPFRQPAFDLIQSIIVSDASVLVASILSNHSGNDLAPNEFTDGLDEASDIEEMDASCWIEFHMHGRRTLMVYEEWMCIPMLWFDVLVGIDPLILPVSFSKAVLWAVSRFSMVELENSILVPSSENCPATSAPEISHLFGWKAPSGYDDGGCGTESKNSTNVSKMYVPLMSTFRRFASHFFVRMEHAEITKQWTWEPMMAESLILLLIDPSDIDRETGRRILEKFSDKRGLTCGLQFLCSSQSSLTAVTVGVRHAVKLVQLDLVLKNFQRLHHFFFVLCKLLKEGNSSTVSATEASAGTPNVSQFSSQGGFLKQPFCDVKVDNIRSFVSSSEWEKFCLLISEIVWPSFQKCLDKGKAFINNNFSQMTCIRLLEIFPVIFKGFNRHIGTKLKKSVDVDWLHHLVDWGRSSLAVVIRYWKKALASLVGVLKETCTDISDSGLKSLQKLISCENIEVDQLNEQVARLSVSLLDENKTVNAESFFSGKSLNAKDCSAENAKKFSFKDAPVCPGFVDKAADNVIILSEDEEEPEAVDVEEIQLKDGSRSSQHCSGFPTQTLLLPQPEGIQGQDPHVKSKHADNSEDEVLSKECGKGVSGLTDNSEDSNLVRTEPVRSKRSLGVKQLPERIVDFRNKDQPNIEKVSVNRQAAISEIVEGDDSWEFSFFKSGKLQMPSFKQRAPGSKRQVIQLDLPMGNKSANCVVNGEVERFKAPRLDDWYKLILELDYFATVGLVVPDKDENREAKNLKEVPVCFTSSDEYGKVFQPLVLEEFKAQLQGSFQEMASLEEICCGSVAVLSVERIDDFHIVRCVHEKGDPMLGQSCSENDLILFTRQKLASSSYDTHMVGKVERRELDNKRRLSILVIRLYLKSGCSRFNRARKFIVERSKWFISRLMSITPQLREFQALSSIREIPLLQVILNPQAIPHIGDSTRMENFSKLPPALQHVLQSSYNDSQQQAISAALGSFISRKDFELSLIQGPPGTGKTRTIVGIISGLLALSRTRDVKKSLYEPRSTFTSSLSKTKTNQSVAIARSWQDATLARNLKEDEERKTKSLGNSPRGRVLVCAHSNAAVDELVSRLTTEGLFGSDGLMYKPYLVRVGNAKTVHPNSLPYYMDTLVDQRVADEKVKSGRTEAGEESLAVLRSNLENLAERIRFYEAKRTSLRDGNSDTGSLLEGESVKKREKELSVAEIDAKLKRLNENKKSTYSEIAKLQAQERRTSEESKTLKHNLRKAILKEAEIVVTTLSGCGGDLYGVCAESILNHKFHGASESALFDAVVIDEAAQALEPATLIPLQLLKSRGTRCIMVGDPKQLPATVLSNIASKYSFQCSMFERLQRAGHPVIMLNEQYRMHPDICRFPASHFYDGKLHNGNQMPSKAVVFHKTKGLGPYVFFDVMDGQENSGKTPGSLSLFNECEADAAVEVLRYFKGRHPLEFVGVKIGIITPYKSQLSFMRSRFTRAFGPGVATEIEFNTIDGFQGREVDILLLSTVRAAEQSSQASRFNHSSIGFLADVRRMNVALTRAKLSLWILGNARTLQTNETWAALLNDARERNVVIALRKPYNSIFRSFKNTTPASELQHSKKAAVQKHNADVDKRLRDKNENSGEKLVAVDDHAAATELQHSKKAKHNADVDKRLSGKNVNSGEELLAVDDHAAATELQHSKKAAVQKHNADVDRRLSGKNVNSGEKLLAVDNTATTELQHSKRAAVQKHNADVDKRLQGKNGNSREKNSAADEHADVENKQCKGENAKKRKYNDGANTDGMTDKRGRKREFMGGGARNAENSSHPNSKSLNSSDKGSQVNSRDVNSGRLSSIEKKQVERDRYGRNRGDRGDHVKNNPQKAQIASSSSSSKDDASNKTAANQNVEKPKDKNMKRKEQRDAVDALLSSALISSKKPASSLKPSSSFKKPSSQNRGANTQR